MATEAIGVLQSGTTQKRPSKYVEVLRLLPVANWEVEPGEEELAEKVSELQKEVLKENNKLQQQKLLHQRAEEHELLYDIVYGQQGKEGELSSLKSLLCAALALRDEQVAIFADVSNQSKQIEDMITDLQQKVEKLSHQNRKKIDELDSNEKFSVDASSQLQLDIHETLQYVLQTLLIATGVDWSQDADFRHIMTGPTTFDYTGSK